MKIDQLKLDDVIDLLIDEEEPLDEVRKLKINEAIWLYKVLKTHQETKARHHFSVLEGSTVEGSA
jgi:hypothetical protein